MQIIKSVLTKLFRAFLPRRYLCAIEEINTIRRYVVINSKWISAPIKLNFNEAIQDHLIITNLSPRHASWLGYYYGFNRSYYQNGRHGINFQFKKGDARYQLVSQDRSGAISYLNTITGDTHTASIITVISASSVIEHFDPVEACYLGVLWGIECSKRSRKSCKRVLSDVPLQLVK